MTTATDMEGVGSRRRVGGKPEIRNPKSEGIRDALFARPCGLRTSDFGLRTSDFGLRTSDFGFRISDFGFSPPARLAYPIPMKKRPPVSRCSISLPKELLNALDAMTEEKGYDNRSLAMADMIRDYLVEHREHGGSREMAGTISIVYDHHKR